MLRFARALRFAHALIVCIAVAPLGGCAVVAATTTVASVAVGAAATVGSAAVSGVSTAGSLAASGVRAATRNLEPPPPAPAPTN